MIKKILIGCWPISGDFGAFSPRIAEKILLRAIENGINSFDVAPNYGNGFAESLIGMVFDGDKNINIYTKCGNHPFIGKDFSDEAINNSFQQSLKRLRQERISGLFLHNPRDEENLIKNALSCIRKIQRNGAVNQVGISGAKNFDYSDLTINSIDIFQNDANLLHLNDLKNKPKSKFFFARSPLATGILGGNMTASTKFVIQDHRSDWLFGPRLISLLKRVDKIKSILPKNLSVPSAARRYLLGRNDIDFLICGISKPKHLNDILNDLNLGPLPKQIQDDLEQLNKNKFDLKDDEEQYRY